MATICILWNSDIFSKTIPIYSTFVICFSYSNHRCQRINRVEKRISDCCWIQAAFSVTGVGANDVSKNRCTKMWCHGDDCGILLFKALSWQSLYVYVLITPIIGRLLCIHKKSKEQCRLYVVYSSGSGWSAIVCVQFAETSGDQHSDDIHLNIIHDCRWRLHGLEFEYGSIIHRWFELWIKKDWKKRQLSQSMIFHRVL